MVQETVVDPSLNKIFNRLGASRGPSAIPIPLVKPSTIHRVQIKNKYTGPPYCRADMYAGRVACCPMVSHVDYAVLRLEKKTGTDGRTDGRT